MLCAQVQRSWLKLAVATATVAVLSGLAPVSSLAQSGSQYLRFQQWCRSIGGTLSGGDRRPNCIPPAPNVGGGGGGGGVVVPSGPSPEQMRREQARAKHAAAVALWRSGNWDQVIRLIEEALALAPGDPVYSDNLNRARAAREDQRRWNAYLRAFSAGQAAWTDRRWTDAVRHFQEALTVDPASASAADALRRARELLAKAVKEADQAAAVPGAVSDSNRRLQELLARPVKAGNLPTEAIEIEAVANIQRLGGLLELANTPAWQQRSRVETVVTILATPWLVAIPYAADAAQREALVKQTKTELQNLLEQTLEAATTQMLADVRRIQPFVWNPLGAEQRAVIAQAEREVAEAKANAAREIRSDQTYREIASGQDSAIEFQSGPALRQLQGIHRNLVWFDQ
jgi:tetratricopeptide (TPR) repeat protein